MTICIAGICDENTVVLAADRMLTEYGTLMVELEPESVKRLDLTDNCMCLTAGSALRPADIKVKLRSEQFSQDVNDIADRMKVKCPECGHEHGIEDSSWGLSVTEMVDAIASAKRPLTEKEIAELIGASRRGVSHYRDELQQHPEVHHRKIGKANAYWHDSLIAAVLPKTNLYDD